MSYTPTVWANGDIITAEKLNKLENGLLSGGVFWITENEITNGVFVLDKTYAEIEEAILNGMLPVIKFEEGEIGGYHVSYVANYGNDYGVYYILSNITQFESNSSIGVLEASTLK